MKSRLITALAVVGALLLGVSGAQAGPPVMDGKKVKVLTASASPGLQEHDQETTTAVDTKVQCAPPACLRIHFVYKPAKGVKGGLMMTATWTNPASDFDLYAVEVGKRGDSTVVGSCGGVGGPHEKVFLSASELHSGRTYALVVFYARSVNDTVTGKVELTPNSTVPSIAPAQVDGVQATNCTLG